MKYKILLLSFWIFVFFLGNAQAGTLCDIWGSIGGNKEECENSTEHVQETIQHWIDQTHDIIFDSIEISTDVADGYLDAISKCFNEGQCSDLVQQSPIQVAVCRIYSGVVRSSSDLITGGRIRPTILENSEFTSRMDYIYQGLLETDYSFKNWVQDHLEIYESHRITRKAQVFRKKILWNGSFDDDVDHDNDYDDAILFHELVHVWQDEDLGGSGFDEKYCKALITHQSFGGALYHYDIDLDKNFNDFGIEQQAQMIEDWYRVDRHNKSCSDLPNIKHNCNNNTLKSDLVTMISSGTAQINLPIIPDTPITSLNDALESNLIWSLGGDQPWTGQRVDFLNDNDSAKAGNISHNQYSQLETTVLGPGRLSFYWKVSSEKYNDRFVFEIDSIEKLAASGESPVWRFINFTIPPGEHNLRWSYSKDYSVSEGDDTAWINQVRYVKLAALFPVIASGL